MVLQTSENVKRVCRAIDDLGLGDLPVRHEVAMEAPVPRVRDAHPLKVELGPGGLLRVPGAILRGVEI